MYRGWEDEEDLTAGLREVGKEVERKGENRRKKERQSCKAHQLFFDIKPVSQRLSVTAGGIGGHQVRCC